MTERPILFSAPMIRSLLDGRKTQTRRIVKPQPCFPADAYGIKPCPSGKCIYRTENGNGFIDIRSPFGYQSDILWVRETWKLFLNSEKGYHPTGKQSPRSGNPDAGLSHFIYAADYEESDIKSLSPWKPAIHMPKSACRTKVEITSVGLERVQDISKQDAIREGIESATFEDGIKYKLYGNFEIFQDSPIASFASLWDSIHGTGAWKLNPFVWSISFKRISVHESSH